MNKRNFILLTVLLAILVIEIVVISPIDLGTAEDAPEKPVAREGESNSAQVMHDAHSIETKGDTTEWELWSKEAVKQSKDSEDMRLKEVRVKLFGDNGVVYDVTGDRGVVVPSKKDMEITGNVVTRSSNGYVFKTDRVNYNSAERKLFSPSDVSMLGPKDVTDGTQFALKGTEMRADMASNEIKIAKNVVGKKKIKGEKVANISSQRATFSGKSNIAIFSGNVVIDIDTLRISGPEARFNYKSGTDSIESMLVSGGVKVTDVDKMATSQEVQVFTQDDRFVFRGTPRVVQNGDELRGDEIVFLDGGKRVKVQNARARLDSQSINAEKKN